MRERDPPGRGGKRPMLEPDTEILRSENAAHNTYIRSLVRDAFSSFTTKFSNLKNLRVSAVLL